MNDPILKILYGPPGTGKTYHAAREAVSILRPGLSAVEFAQAHLDLVASGQIIWVTFHPSYAYEDFVEGFRPEATDQGILYTPRPGPFRIACSNVMMASPVGQQFYVGQHLKSSSGNEYLVIAASTDMVVVRNRAAPGSKGSGLETPVSMLVIERLRKLGYQPGDLSLSGDKVQEKKVIAQRVGVDAQTLFGMTGPLRAVWEHVEQVAPISDERRPVVLVIDEINRGDLSRVFGELITLLEADKRLGKAEERQVVLPYSQTLFGVPPELHIIGTMNTWDRSLSMIDGALRRRFTFQAVRPEPARCAHPYGKCDLPKILHGWNAIIAAVASLDVQIGHSYFEHSALERARVSSGLEDNSEGQLKAIANVIRTSILPLLSDTFRQDWRVIDFVLGRNYATGKGGLLEETDLTSINARGGDIIEIPDAAFDTPAWWDPFSKNWDSVRFRQALEYGAGSAS